jgi:hypothetical protein
VFSLRKLGPVALNMVCAVLIASLTWPTSGLADDASVPAVSGPNGKISVEGGEYDNDDAFLALGSFSLPLSHTIGLQADGAAGTVDGEALVGGGLHLFTRDPSKYLLGAFASYHTWDSIDIWRVSAEVEVYLDRVSLTGLAGFESIDIPAQQNGLLSLDTDDEHFFGKAQVSYYLTDNFKLTGGYRYVSETSLGTVGAEYLIPGGSTPISVFARGDFGEEEYNRVTAGLKIYFGADPDKTLIQRHRTDDPENHLPVFPEIVTASPPATTPPELPSEEL